MKIFRYVNSVSGLCLHLRDTSLKLNLPFDMCRWLVAGEDVEVVHEVPLSSYVHGWRRFDGGGPLVYVGGEDIGGDGDYLRYDQDQTSCIPARGRGPSVVELGEDL